jgi:hypothetical protein
MSVMGHLFGASGMNGIDNGFLAYRLLQVISVIVKCSFQVGRMPKPKVRALVLIKVWLLFKGLGGEVVVGQVSVS